MTKYLNFSKEYKTFEEPEGGWYDSCCVIDGRVMRGLPLGERHAETSDVCLCSAAMRVSHATSSDTSRIHVPNPRCDRGDDGLRASPAAARRGGQAQTGPAGRCRAGF